MVKVVSQRKGNKTLLEGRLLYFSYFSLHNESHSKTVSVQIERLLGNLKNTNLLDNFSTIWWIKNHF